MHIIQYHRNMCVVGHLFLTPTRTIYIPLYIDRCPMRKTDHMIRPVPHLVRPCLGFVMRKSRASKLTHTKLGRITNHIDLPEG